MTKATRHLSRLYRKMVGSPGNAVTSVLAITPSCRYLFRRRQGAAGLGRRLSLLSDCRGVSALEFSLVTPVFMVLILGGVEWFHYSNSFKRAHVMADALATVLAHHGETPVSNAILDQLVEAWPLVNPAALVTDENGNSPSAMSATLASFAFEPPAPGCADACEFVPDLQWVYTAGNQHGQSDLPTCGQNAENNNGTADHPGLPESVIGAPPLIGVFLSFHYQPIFNMPFFTESVMHVRKFQAIYNGVNLMMSSASSSSVTIC